MSDERFDNLMKKRLESVRPNYRPQSWDRFRKRLPLVGFWPWLGQYGGWLLSGLMLAGWLSTFYLAHQNQQVIDQLSETLRETTQRNRQSAKLGRTNPTSDHRVDTVYMVKQTIIEHRHFYSQPGASAPVAMRAHPAKWASPAQTINPPTQSTGSVLADSGLVSAVKHPNSKPENLPIDQQSIGKKLSDGQSAALDSLSQKPSSVLPQQAPASTKPRRAAFRFSTLKPRVGIETLVTQCGVGVGPSTELSLSDNLGLSIGLQAAQVHSRTHRSLKDYNAATGKDFVNQYQPYLPAQYDRIDDIGVHTSVISLPISLKYYVPLKNNWSLLFQTGTNFDLAAYQQVHYDSDYQGDEQYNTFEANAQRRVFHNFVFGAGINFHKSRISGQLVPSYLYDFRSMANMPAGSNFGLRGSVWINLVK